MWRRIMRDSFFYGEKRLVSVERARMELIARRALFQS